MSDLAFRRVAGGLEPLRDVLLCQDPEPAVIWRSRGAVVGRFAPRNTAAARVEAAVAAVGAVAPPGGPSTLPADRVAEYLTLDGVSLVVPADAEVDGLWGELLAACRAAVDDPGEPVAAVTLVAEPPARVHLEHRGSGPLELGFGALAAAIRWTQGGIETGYAGARIREGVVTADPGVEQDDRARRHRGRLAGRQGRGDGLVQHPGRGRLDPGHARGSGSGLISWAAREERFAGSPRQAGDPQQGRDRQLLASSRYCPNSASTISRPSLRYSRSVARTRSAMATGRSSAAAR